jgi:hypothetical protein
VVEINLERNFSKLLLVKINDQFEVQGKLIERKALPKTARNRLRLDWGSIPAQ